MPITRRTIKIKPPVPKRLTHAEALDRMGQLLEAGHGTAADAAFYMEAVHRDSLNRLQSIVAKAEEQRSWAFMDGCFKQATELYVLASILYERFPDSVMMTDAAYDKLGRFLLKYMHKLPAEFRNWYAITAIDLRAGTGHRVVVRPPIRWMVYLLTGQWIENAPEDETGLPAQPPISGVVATEGSPRIKPRPKLRRPS